MINVSTATKQAYLGRESLHKNLKIVCNMAGYESSNPDDYFTYNNEDIISESFELEQHLCDGSVDYTGCVSATCSFSLYSSALVMKKNWWVRVSLESENLDPIILFTGFVNDFEANFVNGEIKYTCYDVLGLETVTGWEFGNKVLKDYFKDRTTVTINDILNLLHANSNWSINSNPNDPMYSLISGYRINFINTSNLINGNLALDKTYLDPDKIFGSLNAVDSLRYICQINGVFGVVNNLGQIDFRKLNYSNTNGTYPSENTIPSEQLYPSQMYIGNPNSGVAGTYEEFKSKAKLQEKEGSVNGVLIREVDEEEGGENKAYAKVSTTVPGGKFGYDALEVWNMSTGDHVYTCTEIDDEGTVYWGNTTRPEGIVINSLGEPRIGDTITLKVLDIRKDVATYDQTQGCYGDVIKIVSNPFIHDRDSATKLQIAQNILTQTTGYSYPQFNATCKGIPFIEVGDYITFAVKDWTNNRTINIECLVLNRTLKGIQHLTDEFSADISEDAPTAKTHYIQSMDGVDGVKDEYDDADIDNRFDDYDTSGEVDDKIAEASQLWNVISSDTVPTNLEARTICFVRGIVTVRSLGSGGRQNDTQPNEPTTLQTP